MKAKQWRPAIYHRVLLLGTLMLAAVQLAPQLMNNYSLNVALRPLYNLVFSDQRDAPSLCADLNVETSSLTDEQRLAIGSILRSLGCMDLAIQVLPEFTTTSTRSALLAYQWGWVAWAQGDAQLAATLWRQGQGIDNRFLIEARRLRATNLDEAQRWYEAAIMAASSPQMQAEAITAYTEETRGRIPSTAFRERLAYLESHFDTDTEVHYRLRGQRSLMGGTYRAAFEQLSQAIALGMTDAESWYLLGDAAWKLNDLASTEGAYRAALSAPIQIVWRRPWHLSRLAALLATTGRSREALPFLEEAVHLSDYYAYSDNLAVLYRQLGETDKAQMLCREARLRAGSAQQSLRCETP